MVKNKRSKALIFILLMVLLCPVFVFAGCDCTGFIDTTRYGSYTVNFYFEGKLYESLTSDEYGYIKKWPTRPEKEKNRFDGWYFYEDYTSRVSGDDFRTYKNMNLYGRFVEYVNVDCVAILFGEDDRDDYEYHYKTYMDKGTKILGDLEKSNVYSSKHLNHDYHGLYVNQEYDWCCDTQKKSFTNDTTTMNVLYDDCSNPFAMVAGEFGEIENLNVHETTKPFMYIEGMFESLSDSFNKFMDLYEIPTDGTEFGKVVLDGKYKTNFDSLYNLAISVYKSSLVPITRIEEKNIAQGAIIGLNYPYSFSGNFSNPHDYYIKNVAKMFGFADSDDFVEYAKTLASTYEKHRQDIINESEDINEALNNGCFYAEDGTFVFPIVIKNEVSPVILTYLFIDAQGRVSIWINDMDTFRRLIADYEIYFRDTVINNKIYCKNTMFIKGATYANTIDENTILNDELIKNGNYNDKENTLTIYQKQTLTECGISYDLGRYAANCDNSENPRTFTRYDYGHPIKAPKTDGSILFVGWKNKSEKEVYEPNEEISRFISGNKVQIHSLQLQAVWAHYLDSKDQKSVEFGFYPQSLKSDDVEILDENNPETSGTFKGYYKGSDGSYYAKITANLYNNAESITVENGTMENGKTYYFKLEPIKWDYVSTVNTDFDDGDDDTKGIVSKYVLDYSTYEDVVDETEGIYANMLIKKWCSDLHLKEQDGYNDTKITAKYDECNPFGMISGEFGEISDIPKKTTSYTSAHPAFHDLGIKFENYITDKNPGTYRSFNSQAYNVFDDYTLVNFAKGIGSDEQNSALIDFSAGDIYNLNSYLNLYNSDVLNACAKLFGLDNQTVLKNRVEEIAARCEKTGYEALENAYIRTIRDSYVFPFVIYNQKDVNLVLLIVDSSRNPYIWVNNVKTMLKAVNFNSSYTSKGDVTNKIYCKNILYVPGPTNSFTTDQFKYYVDNTLSSPTYGQLKSDYRKPKIATDYAIAKGIATYPVSFSNASNHFADWWLSSEDSSGIQYIFDEGMASKAATEYCGVVPFLMINHTPLD